MTLAHRTHAPITVVISRLRSNLDFGPVVKPLGITVKKKAGKVVETSGDRDIVKPRHKRVSKISPEPKKGGPKSF